MCPLCKQVPPPNAVVCPHDGSEVVSASRDPLIGTSVGSWRVLKRLGVGGMGAVYEAVETIIDKKVALKIVHPHLTSMEGLPTLITEAKAVNSIGDKGIVDIFGYGQFPDGRQYLVMELLEGEPLDHKLMRDKRLPFAEIFTICEPLLGTLAAAHDAGFVHRDIKSSNVFIVKPARGESIPKLLDFGLAERIKHQQSMRLGTPNYVAPEQAAGQVITSTADLYAFGCLLFELVTGVLPFDDPSADVVLERHRTLPRPKVRSYRPEAPASLENLIIWMMQVDPAKRPQSANIVLTALRKSIGPKQNRVVIAAGVFAAVLLVAAGAFLFGGGGPVAQKEVVDPVAIAATRAASGIRDRLDGGALGDPTVVDQLLAAQKSFPNRPELIAVRGTVLQQLRLGITSSIASGELDFADQLIGALQRLEPEDAGEQQQQVQRARFAKTHGMIQVGNVAIDQYEHPNQLGAEPTVAVDQADAVSLCEAAGKHLCSETEWQTACAGVAAMRRAFPYGQALTPGTCRTQGNKATAARAGAMKGCVTPEGVYDLSGNVAEWTSSPLREGAPQRVIRGGSFAQSDAQLGCEARDYYLPGLGGGKHIGLRCCH